MDLKKDRPGDFLSFCQSKFTVLGCTGVDYGTMTIIIYTSLKDPIDAHYKYTSTSCLCE